MGPVVIRQFEDSTKETALLTTYLQPGEKSPLLSNQSQSTAGNTIIEYLILGIEHIVPKGLDHILFIIGIFFYALKFKPLLLQVTMFTVAHSITLILASFNLIFMDFICFFSKSYRDPYKTQPASQLGGQPHTRPIIRKPRRPPWPFTSEPPAIGAVFKEC